MEIYSKTVFKNVLWHRSLPSHLEYWPRACLDPQKVKKKKNYSIIFAISTKFNLKKVNGKDISADILNYARNQKELFVNDENFFPVHLKNGSRLRFL